MSEVMATRQNTILQQDCVIGLQSLPAGSVDLVFADPPFNIGYEYDVYEDKLERDHYLDWSRQWMQAVYEALKADGTFWLAIGDEYAAELKLLAQEIGFHPRSWVIWYYTFGVNCKQKFSRSHAHLFYFVKDAEQFTFLGERLENRIPSARQLVYNDKRANPAGRLPDDTWIIRPGDASGSFQPDDQRTWTLRPQDLEACFSTEEDTWYFPRVAGTFKERAGFHGCQMPEQLLGRIIRCCSKEQDLVVDPFAGSGTTLAVARKLGRQYLGFEISEEYVEQGLSRLERITVGDSLDGSEEPTMSAPQTWQKKSSRKTDRTNVIESDSDSGNQLSWTLGGVRDAFQDSHQGYSVERVLLDPTLSQCFHGRCRERGLFGDPRTWNFLLLDLRKSGQLADLPVSRRTGFCWKEHDTILSVSELALCQVMNRHEIQSMEELFCDPKLANEFDEQVQQLGSVNDLFHSRWAALMLTTIQQSATQRAEVLRHSYQHRMDQVLSADIPVAGRSIETLPVEPAAFVISAEKPLYAGETNNLQQQLQSINWESFANMVNVDPAMFTFRYTNMGPELFGHRAWACFLSQSFQTEFYLKEETE